ncbi:MAG: hypothetical protein Q7T19_00970 [Caulobacter sp.]|nr:hypothetical protein [Caulobacter sp.]
MTQPILALSFVIAALSLPLHPIAPDQLARELLSGRLNARSYEYGALAGEADSAEYLAKLEVAVTAGILRSHGVATLPTCKSDREERVLSGVWSAMAARSPAEWREAVRQARDADERRRSLIKALVAGKPSPFKEFRAAERLMAASTKATDPVLRELFQRAALDQATVTAIAAGPRTFGRGISPAADSLLGGEAVIHQCKVGRDNTAWLKNVLARRGWFSIAADGAEADLAAWIIVQHADHDPGFQERVLGMLGPLVPTKDTRGESYGLLFDRVAISRGRPQRYGTQGGCTEAGAWEPFPIEDPGRIDAYRAELGMKPHAEYLTLANRFLCGRSPKPN